MVPERHNTYKILPSMNEKQKNSNELDADETIALDDEGYLKDFNDWSPEIATYLSSKDGIDLTDDHWDIIYFARSYFTRYGISPMPRVIVKELNKEIGVTKYSIKRLFALFPGRPSRSICRYAGLPQPSGCT